MAARVLCVWALLATSARGQDPLAGSYFDTGGSSPPPPPQTRGMRPGGFAPESPTPAGGGGWGRGLAFLGVGAGAMKVYDTVVARQLQQAHERDVNKMHTSLAH